MRHSSSKEAQRRADEKYKSKTYKQLAIRFRKDEDADLLEALQTAHDNGISFRKTIRGWYNASKKQPF